MFLLVPRSTESANAPQRHAGQRVLGEQRPGFRSADEERAAGVLDGSDTADEDVPDGDSGFRPRLEEEPGLPGPGRIEGLDAFLNSWEVGDHECAVWRHVEPVRLED